MTENKRFKHKWNMLGMQFICYDCKDVLLSAFADKEGVEHIVDLLNELNDENNKLNMRINDLEEELDYYKSKCASLETGLFEADRENEMLKIKEKY